MHAMRVSQKRAFMHSLNSELALISLVRSFVDRTSIILPGKPFLSSRFRNPPPASSFLNAFSARHQARFRQDPARGWQQHIFFA